MEHFQAFFNKEAADYMNATEIQDNAGWCWVRQGSDENSAVWLFSLLA